MAASTATRTFSASRNIRLLYASAMVTGSLPFLAVWVVYLTDFRSLTLAQVGVLEGFFWSVAIISEMPTGAFSDRFGRRLTFIVGNVVQGLGLLLFALADSYPLLLVSYVLWALGIAFHSGNVEAYLYEALAADGREDEFPAALGRLHALATGAMLAGALGGAALAGATTLQVPIFAGGAAFFVAVPLAVALRDVPQVRRATPLGYIQTLRESGRALRRDPAAAFMILFGVAFAISSVAGMLLTQPFLQRHDVPVAAFGLFLAPIQLLSIAGALVAYRLPAIFGFGRTMALLFIAPSIALMLMGFVDHVVMFAGFAVTRLAFNLRVPLAADYLNRRTASDIRATVLSVQPLGRSLVLALMAPAAGLLAHRSLGGAFLALGAMTFVAAGASYLLWLRADRASAKVEVREGATRREEAAGD